MLFAKPRGGWEKRKEKENSCFPAAFRRLYNKAMVTGSAVEEGKFPPRRGVILDRWSHHAYKRRRNLSHVLAPKFVSLNHSNVRNVKQQKASIQDGY